MAKPSKFAHVVYSTRRFEEMIDWYQRVFEAKVVYQNPVFAFLTYDDEHAYMQADAFAANPAGVEINPEALLAQYRSGVSEQQLLAQPEGPISPIPDAHGMS